MSHAAAGGALDVDLEVVDRVRATFVAEPGDVVAVIGPNGAGKSSLVAALAGLAPATGHALLDGVDLLPLLARERRVGLAFQDQLLFPHLSARENVAFGPRSRGVPAREARASADHWLARVGVGDLADRLPKQLSGGQAQRVSIARALASEPRLLMLDEPMSGLDVGVASALRIELARHLADYDGVTLLVTHDPIDALTVASRVLVIDDGAVAQYGAPGEVAQRPATSHVARLVGLNVIGDGDRLRSFSPGAVTIDRDRPEGSARNRWAGTIASVSPYGAVLRLVVRTVEDGPELIADVTPGAATELGLTPGRAVWASVKESAVESYANQRR
ncbi:MAG: ABC transporter ATP-binding protein [Nocardioides sp.]|nr:ABC transporter ATP-binding protein [Nocardioides sp.]